MHGTLVMPEIDLMETGAEKCRREYYAGCSSIQQTPFSTYKVKNLYEDPHNGKNIKTTTSVL